ncbi:glycogen/starch/alpha-glucan phosphorylase [Aquibacillus rhizosphaerae]|uniref:Alpha-1,4 glucan phosphorylase n=1 Tax=Aquibacillus rhizosphaerae TaxID=3051431 RepID=A0ABT7L1B9_9BACI|nr:glycogen/starch/alpha-glucan phosphorylase [Aquibacillus sp. LR5S19]MDL4839640.1 glycogen/starch/alpha-glucan phosphorylase [Aquibacillus sp. LR5S19]
MFSNKESFKIAFMDRLVSIHGKDVGATTIADQYYTLGTMVREYASSNWVKTNDVYKNAKTKQVYYLSMEFLLGKLLKNYLYNLDIYQISKDGLKELGIDIEVLMEEEPDAGLGNGGLGRLAADFMDSFASLNLPGHGCGIRYKYGLFEQKIIDGYQVEVPDYWLKEGNVWEVRKSDKAFEVRFGGKVITNTQNRELTFEHIDYEPVLAVPYDMPMVGYKNDTVNTLRLWGAESKMKHVDPADLSGQSYYKVIEYKRRTEAIEEFLYPDDSTEEGKVLRLKQQYFLVSASLQSILERFKRINDNLIDLPDKIAIHTNDTHPVLAIPELMRLLIDNEGLGWEQAWAITTKTISYTNHTILSEALETWPINLFQSLLPRIFMIIEEINERFCTKLWDTYPGDWDKIAKLAILSDDQVKMANLAVIGSHSVNGVSKLHSHILKNQLMKDYKKLMPNKFNNKTNGISHRRWLLVANPGLADIINDAIGRTWIENPKELQELKKYSNDQAFQQELQNVKNRNKKDLANWIYKQEGLVIDPSSIFDVHIKRMHAYKRQLLNLFHIIDLYRRLKENPNLGLTPRTFIFGGKAAPSYYLAKNVVKLINALAKVINQDKTIKNKIKIVFIKNYGVSDAERIIPATDVSEQISTASKEASGTGNMKFMMNGAMTIGTMDGANIEMGEAVGLENMFLFGLKPEEVLGFYKRGDYDVREIYNQDPRLKFILEQLISGPLGREDADFKSIYYSLLHNDEYFVLKDFASYVKAQNKISFAYSNQQEWLSKSILNIANSGEFSSDRTIQEYSKDIWNI